MTLERRRFAFNRHLTWLVPPIDPQRRWIPGPPIDPESCILEGVDGDRWDAVVRAALTAIYHSEVGRAVISCVRRRTSLYHVAGAAQAFPDSYEAYNPFRDR